MFTASLETATTSELCLLFGSAVGLAIATSNGDNGEANGRAKKQKKLPLSKYICMLQLMQCLKLYPPKLNVRFSGIHRVRQLHD